MKDLTEFNIYENRDDFKRKQQQAVQLIKAKMTLASLPEIGSKEQKVALGRDLAMIEYNSSLVLDTFGFYSEHKQYHDTKNLTDMISYLDKEEAELFDIDVRRLDIDYHAKLFSYGIGKFYQGHDLIPPGDNL